MASITAEPIESSPCPRVGLTVSGLTAGNHVITVWRIVGRERVPVRSARTREAYDSLYVEDFEAPLNQTVTYALEIVSGPDALRRVPEAEVVLPSECGYIQDPLDPGTAVPVYAGPHDDEAFFTPGSFAAFTYESDIRTYKVLGSDRPVAMGGRRQAASNVALSMVTTAPEENTRLRDMVMEAPLVVVRPLPEWGRAAPPTATYAAASFTESPLRHAIGGVVTRWETNGLVVRSGSARVVVPLWAYQDVALIFTTYQQKMTAATGLTYLQDIKNPVNL